MVASASDPVEGTWLLTSLTGADVREPDDGVRTVLTLEQGRATGVGGVNRFTGAYERGSEGEIRFLPLAATRMAGPSAAMSQEAAFFRAIERVARLEVADGRLVLRDAQHRPVMVLVAGSSIAAATPPAIDA